MNGKTNHRIYKRVLLVFVMTVLCALFAVSASAETISGECGKQGDNVTWTFDTETGVLTIDGEGEMEDFFLPEGEGYSGITPWYNLQGVDSIVIGNGVTSIGAGAFIDMESLSKITLPDSLKSIGDIAFQECDSLSKIEIPANVEYIGNEVFWSCNALEEIIVAPENKAFSSDNFGVLFNKDKSILIQYPVGNQRTEYIMPETVKMIKSEAFDECFYIKELSLSKNLEIIESFAFRNCLRMKDVIFPQSLKRIDVAAFGFCFSLKNIVLPEHIEYIGEAAFGECISLESITVTGLNTILDPYSLCYVDFRISDGISNEEFVNIAFDGVTGKGSDFSQYMIPCDDIEYLGTIRCHAGSTAEAYAKENGIDCELIHFFGDWVYDWDKLVRSHECEICGYTETEPLEKTENGGVEIVEPVDPDTEFLVEEITKNGDKYAVVEKSLSENLEGSYSVLKTFDITLKNKDGVHVQPDGTVKVKLPLDWDKDGNYKVYRVNDDGTLTDMQAYREGSHMVFDADHFSLYVIVDESPEQPQEENDSPFGFIAEIIRMFKELLSKIITFFQSIGDMT